MNHSDSTLLCAARCAQGMCSTEDAHHVVLHKAAQGMFYIDTSPRLGRCTHSTPSPHPILHLHPMRDHLICAPSRLSTRFYFQGRLSQRRITRWKCRPSSIHLASNVSSVLATPQAASLFFSLGDGMEHFKWKGRGEPEVSVDLMVHPCVLPASIPPSAATNNRGLVCVILL